MAIKSLCIDHFRNLKSVNLEPGPRINILLGENGSGKTSCLEAIYCIALGKSFRTNQMNRLIARGESAFSIVATIIQDRQEHKIGLQRTNGQTVLRIDAKNSRSLAELAQLLPLNLIEPGIHQLVEGTPECRRKFLDWGVFHVEPNYHGIWNRYQQVLKQRNAALKAGWSNTAIAHWNAELAKTAVQITEFRERYIIRLQQEHHIISHYFLGLSEINFDYQRGWNSDLDFETAMNITQSEDRDRGVTQIGPHRADLKILVGQHPARDAISRGQQKILATSLILAQSRHVRGPHKNTVILVDDLPAELDRNHRHRLVKALADTDAQVFLTATDDSIVTEIMELNVPYCVFHVEQDRVHSGMNMSPTVNQQLMV